MSNSGIASSNITSGFIDLATYDEAEKYYYGGEDATSYFVREVRKATWFTQIPVILSRGSGTPEFGSEWTANVSRSGDYMLYNWLRVTFPAVTLSASNQFGANGVLRWTRNLMHNLVEEVAISFNDLVAASLGNYFLDFWAAFTVPAGKRVGYDNMIGNIDTMIQPHAVGVTIPAMTLNLPIPLFYSRDTGIALPTAAIPYNEMKITCRFRPWSSLLILDNTAAAAGTNPSTAPTVADLGGIEPKLTNVNVWANYALVSNDERSRMSCAPRDILIEQQNLAPRVAFMPSVNASPSYDIRFSHAVKLLFFGIRNSTTASEWSNYTAASPVPGSVVTNFAPSYAVDPISAVTLSYESNQRFNTVGSDYFSLINPYYHAPSIPMYTGYHMYSYALEMYCLDPTGSTNYGKLNNVSFIFTPSPQSIEGNSGTGPAGSGADYAQKYETVIMSVNHNIVRIAGGTLGFPII